MGVKRSSRACNDWKICAEVFVGFILIWAATNSFAATNPVDVAAINRLFAALGSPQLPGWVQSGGDPCLEAWQGVQCNASDIITIILNGANLGGELGDSLSEFASITVLDLSNNHIGGSIPPNLPVTLKNLFLSANQFSGSIPSSVATLTLLTDMSMNNNLLSGEIPNAFESLTGLINLDLSTNNLSGQLPPTLENLSLLTTLNIENNLFSGTIPDKMLQGITNFRKDGNPCNTTTPVSPPTSSVTPPPSILVPGAPPPPPSQSQHRPGKQDGPSTLSGSRYPNPNPDPKDHPDHPDHPDHVDHVDHPDHPDHADHPDHLGHPDHADHPDHPDQADHPDPWARLVTRLVSRLVTPTCHVAAINRLFAALGLPQLPGWVQNGGDPCLEAWQGVQCNASDIITIILNGANLGGELGDSLGDFASITVLGFKPK
ncbi:hypothetical protein EZV62_020479 [Acer yangbiense]|uniref:Leucine-rich repeat-containing N-terminal plant-type domain-containing protein n=1 Tax=Acer yangbiense TaxID=1000413 RepID=A0A5C7HDJ7_9ROSI|nr:hypothetical protein EZV62_020479 [Acer yangbiense]